MSEQAYGWDTYPDTETKSFFIRTPVDEIIPLVEKLEHKESPLWVIDIDGNLHMTYDLEVIDYMLSHNEGCIYFDRESTIGVRRDPNLSPHASRLLINKMISMIGINATFEEDS